MPNIGLYATTMLLFIVVMMVLWKHVSPNYFFQERVLSPKFINKVVMEWFMNVTKHLTMALLFGTPWIPPQMEEFS